MNIPKIVCAQECLSVQHVEGKFTRILPYWWRRADVDFLDQRRNFVDIPMWWQECQTIANTDTDNICRLLMMLAFNKPRSSQSLARYMNLDKIDVGSFNHTFRANMLGVYEQLKHGMIPVGEDGNVYIANASYGALNLYSVVPQTKGAAKRFLREIVEFAELRQQYEKAGINPDYALDFETM